jgi:hypothetical protein
MAVRGNRCQEMHFQPNRQKIKSLIGGERFFSIKDQCRDNGRFSLDSQFESAVIKFLKLLARKVAGAFRVYAHVHALP